jgi:hypothetical protein
MSFLSCATYVIFLGAQINRIRLPGHVVLWERGEVYTRFGGETSGKETTWKTVGVDWTIIKMALQEVGWGQLLN